MKNVRPMVRKPVRWWQKAWWAFLLILLLGGAAGWYFFANSGAAFAKQAEQDGVQYQTAAIRRGDVRITASGSGTLVANQSVDLSFSTTGTVVELNVALGDEVKAGDVLAKLGNSETLQANLASAELALLQAQQNLEDMQRNANVALAQSYQDYVTAQQALTDAQEAYERTAMARCGKEVSTKYAAALDRATEVLKNLNPENKNDQAVIDARHDYDTALANYNYCIGYTETEKTNASAELELAKNTLQQAETKYNTLKTASGIDPSELELAEASVKEAETKLAEAKETMEGITLVAPIAGKVIYLAAGKGEAVDTAAFLTIADTGKSMLEVSIDENDMDKLLLENTAMVVFDALPDRSFNGKVVQVDPQLTTSGQYRVAKGKVELDDAAGKTLEMLPLGLNASVTIISQEVKDVLLVPLTALQKTGEQGYTVNVVGSDGQMKPQPVEVGLSDASYAEVRSGLKEGDVVSTGVLPSLNSSSGAANNQGGADPMEVGPAGGGMLPPP